MTQVDPAEKYHWRIKYPKTFEMAVRNNFIAEELLEDVDQEIEARPEVSTLEFKVARRIREMDNLGAAADTLADAPTTLRKQLRRRGRRGRNRHTELAGSGAEWDEMEINALLEEVQDRLTRIESALRLKGLT
jgi:hypothetical protein